MFSKNPVTFYQNHREEQIASNSSSDNEETWIYDRSKPQCSGLERSCVELEYMPEYIDVIRLYREGAQKSYECEAKDFYVARHLLNKALELVQQNGTSFIEFETIYCDIAMTYIDEAKNLLRDFERSRDCIFECLEQAEQYLPDKLDVREYKEKFPEIYKDMAQLYSLIKNYQKALMYYSKCITASEFLGDNSITVAEIKEEMEKLYEKDFEYQCFVKEFEKIWELAISLDNEIKECRLKLGAKLNIKHSVLPPSKPYFDAFYVKSLTDQKAQFEMTEYLTLIYMNLNNLDFAERFAEINKKLAGYLKEDESFADEILASIQSLKNKGNSEENLLETLVDQNDEDQKYYQYISSKCSGMYLKIQELFQRDHPKEFCIYLFNECKTKFDGYSDCKRPLDASRVLCAKGLNINAVDVLFLLIFQCPHLICLRKYK